MSDFEVHSKGTGEEIRLSRRLAEAVASEQEQWHTVPLSIMKAYNELYEHYLKHIEMERDR